MGSRHKKRSNPPPGAPTATERDASTPKASSVKVTTLATDDDQNPANQNEPDTKLNDGEEPNNVFRINATPETAPPKSSWYGTWPKKKATASLKVARDTIMSDKSKSPATTGDVAAGAGCAESYKSNSSTRTTTHTLSRPPSMMLGKSRKTTSDVTIKAPEFDASNSTETIDSNTPRKEGDSKSIIAAKPPGAKNDTQLDGDISMKDDDTKELPVRSQTSSTGWLYWFGQSTAPTTAEEAQKPAEAENVEANSQRSEQENTDNDPTQEQKSSQVTEERPTTARSWFGYWPYTQAADTAKPSSDIVPEVVMTDTSNEDVKTAATTTQNESAEAPKASESQSDTAAPRTNGPAPGSSWAFWYRDTNKSSQTVEETGQLAIKGDASQNRPQLARASITDEDKTTKSTKRDRTEAELDEAVPKVVSQKASESPKKKTTAANVATSLKTTPPNLLLPSFRSTYHPEENPTMIQQISRLLLRSKQPVPKQCAILRTPPKIKKAVAIGIHGLFPAAFLRTVIGQPTGTSVRFSNHAAAAIKRWAASNGRGFQDIEIEKVALEGEGKIGERVDNLWNLLLNWSELLKQADFIFVACHSQGVPVGIMLVARLIESGIISSTARVGVCAMAGVSLGPFPDYKSRFLGGSAAELYDFANLNSKISKKYVEALRVAVKFGARITYCGSIDDQLVSLESSTFSIVSHPYIFRTVFIDGRIHAPDFMAHLVGFALKLRNLGISDHSLIRELSAPLAGSLYTGEGHSRLYDDPQVYDLVVEHTLQTTMVGDEPLRVQDYEAPINQNPYLLPWSIRGLLEEDIVKTDLNHETVELLRQFEEWKPTTKALKDVKFRLEAVRSKL